MKKWLYKSKNTDLNIDNLINTTSGNSISVNSLDNTINTEISEIQQKNTTLVNDSSSNSTSVNSLDNTINTEISEIQQNNTTLVNDSSSNSTSVNSLDNTINTEISEIQQNNTTLVNVCTMLARVAAAKPHSADVERLISASNLLKSPLRSTMNIETENLSLYINYNMPPLYGWDPRDTVYHWMFKKKHRVLKRRKGKEQGYFSGVFFEAFGKNKIINSDDSGEDTEDKKKKNFNLLLLLINYNK
ncbi:uncharacterized protein LOC100573221 [Acyrthosiphon pisum]|uniref:ACYPI22751 protein n=1 Tax=Acyrthosiphon pisum TaxID=7029 RepID=C4WXH2_ACYPI|nr:uncharacterized protein LOC100573221 [Acyrthosiphon pisum]BAH72592.1 ACYPI22751 [Acyrthosiphon pisum]|eukprot:NP_001192083.1 uncharacterized protein LOC100573221 [Acyrthosiphon pisum]